MDLIGTISELKLPKLKLQEWFDVIDSSTEVDDDEFSPSTAGIESQKNWIEGS
jgi:hypothetical protein